MAISSITILGGDLRQCYTAEYLYHLGWQVTCFHTPDFPYIPEIQRVDSLSQALEHADLVLAPTPLSKDGTCLFQANSMEPSCLLSKLWNSMKPSQALAVHTISKELAKPLHQKGCRIFEFSNSPVFTLENSMLTAEGLLSELIRYTPFSLSSANILLLGYGRCGTAIGKLLHSLCRSIYVLEQESEKLNQAEKNGICPVTPEDFSMVLPQCNIVINTIPASVLEPTQLQKLPGSCHIFDIASAPFGFPADVTEKYLLPYFRIPGIPGRFSPVTAGHITGKVIERMTDYAL